MKPHGQEEARDEVKQIRHRAVADLTGVGRGAHRRFEIAKGGLGLEPTERGASEGAAGLGRAGSVKPIWVD
jgi:hypothetical protein